MQHGSKFQGETWFLECLEPLSVEIGQNDRTEEWGREREGGDGKEDKKKEATKFSIKVI